ncbi:MAG: hypothetical protein KGN84_01560, partial [Acidobacteriota bacterium]|nr:hypothetical protein [Acidobacteriota bacterium]
RYNWRRPVRMSLDPLSSGSASTVRGTLRFGWERPEESDSDRLPGERFAEARVLWDTWLAR